MKHEHNGRTLIKLANVSTTGGDGPIDNDISDEKSAVEKIISHENSDIAYFWCNKSNRLIQKSPEKRTGKWNSEPGTYFMYADKVLGNGQKYLYAKIKMTQFDQVFGIVCAQEWYGPDGQTFNFENNGKGTNIQEDFALNNFTWLLNGESKIVINNENESEEYEMVWKTGVMALESDDPDKTLTA
jgi:hypothetical protein